ncbi:hypothetical protein BJ742DRAFT_873223 [Cladochytrium replicatum]|nr:hypothetical protein BJ742DRAFT_873223 [Cladochytrium replicatum]
MATFLLVHLLGFRSLVLSAFGVTTYGDSGWDDLNSAHNGLSVFVFSTIPKHPRNHCLTLTWIRNHFAEWHQGLHRNPAILQKINQSSFANLGDGAEADEGEELGAEEVVMAAWRTFLQKFCSA